jgi:hypothetical protein
LVIIEEKLPPKILVLDIETKPILAYAWRMFDEIRNLQQVIDTGGLLCFAARWLGKNETFFYAEWQHGREEMVKAAHRLISEADAVITYNGDKFDIPKLAAEFVTLDLPPPPPVTSIDVYKTTKQMGFLSKKLDFVAQALGVGKKVEHEGMPLWIGCMEGCVDSQTKMKSYNIGDIDILEGVYLKVRPYIKNHPHMGFTPKRECGACGSSKVHVSKYRRTKAMRIQQLHCQDCGSYFDGTREKVV